jgi:hypothetical protein
MEILKAEGDVQSGMKNKIYFNLTFYTVLNLQKIVLEIVLLQFEDTFNL